MTKPALVIPSPPPIGITCVAGTWGWRGLFNDPKHWTHPKSPFWSWLSTLGLHCNCDQNGVGYTWGTRLAGYQLWRRLVGKKPDISDWEVAAAGFNDYHRPPTVPRRYQLRGRNIHSIAHSHGGNVPYIACSAYGLRINVLATVSTPIRMDVLRVHGERARKNIGHHIHFWSEGDRIQAAGEGGDGHLGILREHPFADINVKLPEDCGHSGLLENPFYFEALLPFVDTVKARNNNPGYLSTRLFVP